MEELCRYHLKTILGKTFIYVGIRSYKILLDFVCTSINGNRDEIRLIVNDSEIASDSDLPITECVIYIVRKGGAANLRSGAKLLAKAIQSDPPWLLVRRGINFKAECINPGCESRQNGGFFYVSCGMGVYDLRSPQYQSFTCPGCNQVSKLPVVTVAFLGECEYVITGQKMPSALNDIGEQIYKTGVVEKDYLYEFVVSVDMPKRYVVQWKYLNIRLRENLLPVIANDKGKDEDDK